MKEVLKQKFSSRKFWIGLIVVAMGIVLCCLGDHENGMTLINIGALGYLGAEGLTDIFGIVFSCELFNPGDVAEVDAAEETEETENDNSAG